ncbi:MAG TPA: transketolase C-terminal domain-containing protein [Thermoleophilia bacterium]|nr:transketolase C-terminal domain-containing protein [Thermoleophilia bacterium]
MPELMAQRDAFGKALVDLGTRNERVVVVDADLASSTKAAMFEAAYPERFFQMGVTEQNVMGVAAGLATMGFVPFANTFACFATKRALDQIRISIAQPRLHVIVHGGYGSLFVGKSGKTHQAHQDVAIMRSMPNMTVVAPGDGVEARKAVFAVADCEGPVYLRLTRDPCPVIFDDGYDFRIGPAAVVRDGDDVTIMTTGIMLGRAVEAAEALEADGIGAHILHVPTLKPLDVEAIVAAADKTGLVVTAEEHTVIGGLGGAVAETLGEHRPTPMKRVGIADRYSESAANDALIEKYGLTSHHIADAARALLARHAAGSPATV